MGKDTIQFFMRATIMACAGTCKCDCMPFSSRPAISLYTEIWGKDIFDTLLVGYSLFEMSRFAKVC